MSLVYKMVQLLVLVSVAGTTFAQQAVTTLPESRPICLDSTQADIQASILHYEAIYQTDSTNLDACKNIAMSYYKLQDFATAIAYFDRIIEWDSCYPGALSNRGYCKFFLKDKVGACQDWSLALDCNFPEELEAILLNGYQRYCD